MQKEYYLAVNGRQEGPFSIEDLRYKKLTGDSLVWRVGLNDWVKASQLPELEGVVVIDIDPIDPNYNPGNGNSGNVPPHDEPVWFAMFGDNRVGPVSISELIDKGVTPQTPIWREGMSDWAPAQTRSEIMDRIYNRANNSGSDNGYNTHSQYPNFGQNPQCGQQPNFGQNPQYGQQQNFSQNPYRNNNPMPMRTNWMTWAIIATIISFFCSCIGVIFGIIGIVQANKANGLYMGGFDTEAEQANNTAKIMTIIAFVLAGIGLVASGVILKNGYSALSFF
ncbi:MAG: GYF domain-containing protein [Muribaculaceae bacterium]|jgi:hypothetical protein